MFLARYATVKMMPLLIVLWAASAILGGTAHQANAEAGPQAMEAIVETGAKLCVASIAFIGGFRAARHRRPGVVRLPVPTFLAPRPTSPAQFLRPPVPEAPRLHLLQILRT